MIEKTNNLGAGIFCTMNFNTDNSESLSWNLGSSIEVFNAELFAIEKAFKIFSINVMELETSIPPPKVKFKRICKNYA